MNITKADLRQFSGTENYYKGWCGVRWTDGVQFLATNGLGWLITDICSYMVEEHIRSIPFQVWTLRTDTKNRTAVLTMQEDSDKPLVVEQKYDFTDNTLEEIKLYLIDGILLLESEY